MRINLVLCAAVLLEADLLDQRAADFRLENQTHGGVTLSTTAITDPSLIALTSDFRFVGREIAFDEVRVDRADTHGFWISTLGGRDEVFVIPAEGALVDVRSGDAVSIHGEVRQMSAALRRTLLLGYAWDEHIYIHAFTVRPTGLWRDE